MPSTGHSQMENFSLFENKNLHNLHKENLHKENVAQHFEYGASCQSHVLHALADLY